MPPAGARPLSTTVPVDICPETTVEGLNESMVTTGARTVSVEDVEVVLGSVAVMLTFAFALTGSVVMLNVPLLAPPAILKLTATVAAEVLLLIRPTVSPPGGAGPVRTRLPIDPVPPVTEAGLSVSDMIAAGFTCSVAVCILAPSEAVIVTFVAVATPTVVAVNVFIVAPPGMVTLATVTEGSELVRTTMMPPAGAA